MWQEEDLAGITCNNCEGYFVSSPGSNINMTDKNINPECPRCAEIDEDITWPIRAKRKKEKK